MRRLRRAFASDKAKIGIVAVVTAAIPVSMALLAVSGSLDAERSEVLATLERLWLVGAILGLVLDLVYAARGALIVRDPAAIVANMARNQRIGLAVVPVAVVAAVLLAAISPDGTDYRLVVVAFLAGLLAPLMAAIVYITFRIRPDELFSADLAVARTALERLRGNDRNSRG